MPLPTDPQTVWPPKDTDRAADSYRKWAAWWAGDVAALAVAYSTAVGYADTVVDGVSRTALAAARPRMFHGAPAAKGTLQPAKLHIPLASDIAMTSADLLFGEPPALVAAGDDAQRKSPVSAKGTPTQDRLDFYMANGLQSALLEGGEIASAFGGVYIRAGWDSEVADHPLFDAIPPDAAAPEFRSGRLVAVTFHRVLPDLGDGKTWRHLERHEKGRILHGLFASGDDRTLGVRRPLQDHPDTAGFAALVGRGDAVETGATGLTAEYVPNMRPNRRLRGSQLGRSDFDGIEHVMDALDETWSSWLRDLRLGKGRILVPEVYLESAGRGQGALFDLEQEVFQQLNALPGGGANGGLALTSVQFNIRVDEHQRTSQALLEQAVRGAGYSAQSFGLQGDGGLATATEVQARKDRSMMTRGKKINYWRPPLARIARTALEIDVKQYRPAGVTAVLPDVDWPDGVATDPNTQAQTLQLLKGAEAASTRTRVEMLHPDWDDKRVSEEVKAIESENAPPAPPDIDPPGTTTAPNGRPGGDAENAPTKTADGKAGDGQTPTGTTPPAVAARPRLAGGRPAARKTATAGRRP